MLHFCLYKQRFLKYVFASLTVKLCAMITKTNKQNHHFISPFECSTSSESRRQNFSSFQVQYAYLQEREKLTAYIQSWPDASQFQNKQFSYINTVTVESILPYGKLEWTARKWSLHGLVSSWQKRSPKSNQKKHWKYCATSLCYCFQK